MKLSHSKLSTILTCPMTYYLSYKMGITPKVEKPALSIGSAVHYGIEHNSSDLSVYFEENGILKKDEPYKREQYLAEAMVDGYLEHKNELFDEILKDEETGGKLNLIEETHELYLTAKLKSYTYPVPHEFVGIIDLLLLTDKGFIIIDYKTSSRVPDWNTYIEQLYKYIFIVQDNFPGIPILKIAIINLRKTNITQKKNESIQSFKSRLKMDYSLNDDQFICLHIYNPDSINKNVLDEYVLNLSRMADTAQLIDLNNMWFINYTAANGQYGKSQFWDIFYRTPSCFVLYDIADRIYDEDSNKILTKRDCREIDMKVIDSSNILNKYEQFKVQALAYYSIKKDIDKDDLFIYLKSNFITDDYLLNLYWKTLMYEIENNIIDCN